MYIVGDFSAEPLKITRCTETGGSDTALMRTPGERRSFRILHQHAIPIGCRHATTTITGSGNKRPWTPRPLRTFPQSFYKVVGTE